MAATHKEADGARRRRTLSFLLRAAVGAILLASPALAQQRSTGGPSRPAAAPAPAPAAPKPRPPVPTDDADLDPANPPVLPPAPRAKMHGCGREWQDMKRRGTDRDQTWRQFATRCLLRD